MYSRLIKSHLHLNYIFHLMGKLILIFCLLPSMYINAQIVDWKNFDNKIMNEAMFNRMNEYVKSMKNGDSLIRLPLARYSLKKISKKHLYGIDGTDVLSLTPCTYQEIAENYIIQKLNDSNLGARFFMTGGYKNKAKVMVSSHYKKKSKQVDITFLYVYDLD